MGAADGQYNAMRQNETCTPHTCDPYSGTSCTLSSVSAAGGTYARWKNGSLVSAEKSTLRVLLLVVIVDLLPRAGSCEHVGQTGAVESRDDQNGAPLAT